jgi:phytoene/squalene synthetase
VVCNADLPVAYRTLLGGVDAPRVARRGKYSPSCVLWVAGVRGTPPPEATHHNIHFGADWSGAFKALIEDGVRMPDPSILVTLHSLDDASLAPEGCSSIYVLEPTPNLDGHIDWSAERDRITDDCGVAWSLGLGYPTDVVVERIYDPLDWESLGMERGTPFALAHTFRQTGPFRPATTSTSECRVRVHRVVDGARGGCADGAGVGQVWRRSGSISTLGHRHRPLVIHLVLVRSLREVEPVKSPFRRHPPTPTTRLVPEGPVTLDESYELCRQFNKRHGTTYYWSTLVLPAVKRHHVHALYGFARYADDIVDEIPEGGHGEITVEQRAAALASFGDRFFADLERGRSDDPVLKAVVHTVRAFDLDPEAFRRFLRSMTMDLTVESYETWDDLLDYMDGSAAVIGEMMLPILEPTTTSEQPSRTRATSATRSSSPTSCATSTEDLDRHRQYVPQEDMRTVRRRSHRAAVHPGVRRADEVRDRSLPRAVSHRPSSASPCCPNARPAASAPRTRSTAASSTRSRRRGTTCSRSGQRVDRRRRRSWSPSSSCSDPDVGLPPQRSREHFLGGSAHESRDERSGSALSVGLRRALAVAAGVTLAGMVATPLLPPPRGRAPPRAVERWW